MYAKYMYIYIYVYICMCTCVCVCMYTCICMYWRRKWQPTPVFLPGESNGRRSLVGCSPWGRTESETTEATWQHMYVYIRIYDVYYSNVYSSI